MSINYLPYYPKSNTTNFEMSKLTDILCDVSISSLPIIYKIEENVPVQCNVATS